MNKFTQILSNKNWTEKMVEDFNNSNQDLKGMELEELNTAHKNLSSILASLDDLKRSLKEELEERNRDKDKEAIDCYLSNFIEPSKNMNQDNRINRFSGFSNGNGNSNNNIELEEVNKNNKKSYENAIPNSKRWSFHKNLANEFINPIASNNKGLNSENDSTVEIPNMIFEAVAIANKYKINVEPISDGAIIKMLQNGEISVSDALVVVVKFYVYVMETGIVTREDVNFINNCIQQEADNNPEFKNLLATSILFSIF